MDNRIGYIDAVKGIVMLFVILGHIGRLPGFINGSIYSFHMPLFFVVSGFFIKPQNSISLKKQVKALLLPYAVVGGAFFYIRRYPIFYLIMTILHFYIIWAHTC